MLKKLVTREIKASGGWPGSRQIERSNILTHEVDAILVLQKLVWSMVELVKQAPKNEQKNLATESVKSLADRVALSNDWDAEQAIRELAKTQWAR